MDDISSIQHENYCEDGLNNEYEYYDDDGTLVSD